MRHREAPARPSEPPTTNVFVLCTGRCGSVTFARASGHLTNFTAGHESRSRRVGPARLDYPTGHIEVDNRLSWLLGSLGRRFDGPDVLYVHLTRDPEAVAQSYLKRWDSPYRASMVRAYGHGVIQRVKDWPKRRRIDVCRHYVETVTANIEDFLRDRPSVNVSLENVHDDFSAFLDRIGADGDRDAALGEWATRHNASRPAGAAVRDPGGAR